MNESKVLFLNTGASMPMLGLGTWNAPKDTVGVAVEMALTRYGYSHIDCAHVYENEPEIGEALHRVFTGGARKRDDVFMTSKLWNYDHARVDVRVACEKTLRELQLDYLDLYLMHFGVASPHGNGTEPVDAWGLIPAKVSVRETWEAMQELVNAGLVKAIGISNFTAPMIVDLLTYAKIVPAVNQIELHPYNQQIRLIEFCRHLGIVLTAYSPLGSQNEMSDHKPVLMSDEVVKRIAQTHDKSPAQILLRWGIQRQTVVIPKSTREEHIKENAKIFEFQLSEADMVDLAKRERHLRYVDPYEWWKLPYFD